jgi:hypothetical protein
MITDKGKEIFGKYLVGSAPAYASYIAIGCGAAPNPSGYETTAGDLSAWPQKTSLDFEMFRVPITSRGFVQDEDGNSQVVFSAEVPTTERYEITEVGIFSASSNPSSVGYDSRTLYAFTREEPWKYLEAALFTEDQPLDNLSASKDLSLSFRDNPAIQTNATNRMFRAERVVRSEQSRYFNNMIMLSSNFSDLSDSSSIAGEWDLTDQDKISLATSVDLSRNSPLDQVKLALSVVDVDGTAGVAPNRVRVTLEFTTVNSGGSFRLDFESEVGAFSPSRYRVLEQSIGEGKTYGTFLWSAVNNVNIYAAAVDEFGEVIVEAGTDLPYYYIALDAIRLENIGSKNPLYAMTGYTVIENTENGVARPIVKLPNTSAMVEFRLGVGVFNG